MNEDSLIDIESMPPGFVFNESRKKLERCPQDFVGSVDVPEGVKTIGKSSFENVAGLQKVHLPESLARIKDNAFMNCTNLESINIPSRVNEIGEYAFYGCRSLSSLTLPDGLRTIGTGAFADCMGLDAFTIPATVVSMGKSNPFVVPTSSVTSEIYANKGLPYRRKMPAISRATPVAYFKKGFSLTCLSPFFKVENGCLIDVERKTLMAYVGSNATCVIPSGIEIVGALAFACNPYIKTVVIPDTVTSIESSAFSYCTSLVSVEIPDSVQSFGEGVFCGCGQMKCIRLPKFVKVVTDNMFIYCDELENVLLPDFLESIESLSFGMCRSLRSVTIPRKVSHMGSNPFFGCGKAKIVCQSDSFDIEDYCLICKQNNELVSYVGDKETVVVPNTVQRIGARAFENNQHLVRVVVPSMVNEIADYAFVNCHNLQEVNLSDFTTSIGDGAFKQCIALQEIKLPLKLMDIGHSAFEGCSALTKIEIRNHIYSSDVIKLMEEKPPIITPNDLVWASPSYINAVVVINRIEKENERVDAASIASLSEGIRKQLIQLNNEVAPYREERERNRRFFEKSNVMCYSVAIRSLTERLEQAFKEDHISQLEKVQQQLDVYMEAPKE